MARKTPSKAAPKAAKNPTARRAIDDNYVAPKKRGKKADKTFAEVLAEQAAEDGVSAEEVVEQLTAPPAPAERPTREAGMSNLATTIRSHRANYTVALHPNGKKTQNNGDPIAQALLLVSLADLKAFAHGAFGKTYDQLNPGHARMCIGNLIRGALRKGDANVVAWFEGIVAKAAEAGRDEA